MNATTTTYRLNDSAILFHSQEAAEAAAVARYMATGAEARVTDADHRVVYELSYGE